MTIERAPRMTITGQRRTSVAHPLHRLVYLGVDGADQALDAEERLVRLMLRATAADQVEDLIAGQEDVAEFVGNSLLHRHLQPGRGLGEGDGFIVHSS